MQYIPVHYNCSIIDLYDRRVVASKNGRFITSTLAVDTLKKALIATGCNPKKLILHSDQGSQITSIEFTGFCEKAGITQSMSKTGYPYENAPDGAILQHAEERIDLFVQL